MERSEPSLVPEWLKGAGGGGGAAHHSQPPIHQDESGNSFLSRQRPQPSAAVNHGDYDSPRYNSAGSDRAFYPTSRRGATNNSTGASERPLFDRGDSYPRAYNSFGRSSGYRGGYEGSLDREREGPRDRERDWDWERDRERDFRDRDRALGFGGGDDRDRDRDRSDAPGNFRRSSSGAGLRYETEAPLRRSQSIGGTGRVLENGDKKATADVGSPLPTAPPTNIGTLTSSMQKAAFERNFPSLGAQEKQSGVVQSSLGNVSVLSPRPSWQSSSPRPDGVRSATSGAGLTSAGSASVSVAASGNVGGSVIGGDGWTSALADVPSSLTGLPSSMNGVSGATSVPTATTGASVLASVAAPSLTAPKMSEAVAYPPRVRTPPQSTLESQRVEESAAKQSRQLILKPTLPKNMGSRDITKPKVIRAVDVVAPQPMKLSQPLASQLVSSPYRPPAPPRPEPLKAPQGKLLVRKTSKEAVAAMLSPSSIPKGDGTGSTSVVSAAGALVGMGGTNAGTNASGTLAPPRKQKQLLDRRAVPIPPISVPMGSEGGSGPRSKESGSASEDKRPPIPAQNRSDFFNALRKKAAGISSGSLEKMESGALQKNDGVNEKGVEAEEETGPFQGDVSQMAPYQLKENGTAASTFPKSSLSGSDVYGISDTKEDAPSNGASTEGAEGNSEQSSTAPSSPVAIPNRATATEEEEAAFLRSLGWEESAEESGEGLTEEEINSFYQERLRSMSVSPSLPNARNHRLRDVRVDLHVGSIGSISSGMSSSDSESDDDLRVRRRS
ncbi:unnamed protein product [Calypogeia fissa]